MPLLHEPEVTLEDVKIQSCSLSSLELDVTIKVQNRNPLGVTLRELPFKVLCRDAETVRQVGEGNTGLVKIAAKDSTLLHVPVRSDNAILITALAALVCQGSIQATIKGRAVINCILFKWTVPFSRTVPVTMDQVVEAACGGKK